MNRMQKMTAKYLLAFVCAMSLFTTALFGQDSSGASVRKTPTHSHVSYGSEERQWLNLYLPSGNEPAPVYLYAHHNTATADDVLSSWADPTVASGIAIVSWESIAKIQGRADFKTCAADAKMMFAWVKENAATYNLDINKIFIGGQSRGSIVSWELAHSQAPGIAGIYMGQALPGQSYSERMLEPITKNAPPIFLAYRKEPGAEGDIHDAAHGIGIVERYKELGIGNRAELVHSLNQTSDNQVMQFLPEFVRTVVSRWSTPGFAQANTMGAGEATISKDGKFRVFVLMGQSNMHGAGRATNLRAPYTETHERIRIWANGRWEYFVPTQRHGPGVSFAHQLAEFWPNDTIGIIKVAVGATGINAFAKDWSFERAQLTYDGKKGPLYQDLMNAVVEARRVSNPEFCGFFWKQAAADGSKKELAAAYYKSLETLIADLRTDLEVPDLPVFIPSYMTDKKLLRMATSAVGKEVAAKTPTATNDVERLEALLSYLERTDGLNKVFGKRRYLAQVIMAQNRAGREMSNVTTLYDGDLPRIGGGNPHYNSEGYVILGQKTADAVEAHYKGKE
ncbi:sialate O-acetylesterase [Pelagicoccus mobilis]|uniref:Sialate O-acetylesterase domain-containing protein n=1 Tax=Pelagicoccus mobilis TaxID=415221 RepID=A0A934VU63_9BACT|nr:sialate O-acetylesterase [Pelagicoccus mobilis]MBK1880433.1 hypothetical protein [Pelagicoccus mobilis]